MPTTRALAQWKAASWNGDPSRIGVYGSSSGRHVAELSAHASERSALQAIPCPRRRSWTRQVAYIAMRSPISDPYARYPERREKQPRHDEEPRDFFKPWNHLRIRIRSRSSIARRRSPSGDVLAGRARRQRAAGVTEEIRTHLSGRWRSLRLPPVRGQRTRVGGQRRAADRPRAGVGQGVRRAPIEDDVSRRRNASGSWFMEREPFRRVPVA